MCVTTLCATVESCGLFPSCVLFTFSLPFNSTFLSPSLVLFNDHLPVSPLRLRASLLSSLLVFFFLQLESASSKHIRTHATKCCLSSDFYRDHKEPGKAGKGSAFPLSLFFFFSTWYVSLSTVSSAFVFVAIWLDVCLLCEVYISFLAALTFGLCLTRSKAASFPLPLPSFQFLFFLNIRVTATKKTAFLDFYRTRIDAI